MGKLNSHMQKNEMGSLSFNINRNQFKDLSVRPKTMKFLEKEDKLLVISFDNDFFVCFNTRSKALKAEMNK